MENRLMSFNEFNSLYESYGFVIESEALDTTEPALFDPAKPDANKKEIAELFATAGAANEEPANENAKPSEMKAIVKGEKGARVIEVQKYLGIKPADGIFGPGTETKVKEFQKANGLTVDGKVGVQTLRKMLALKGNVKTTTEQDKLIVTKFIVKTTAQAKTAGVDPKLLSVFKEVQVIKYGSYTYVICIPKEDAAKTVKELDGKGLLKANWEWVKKAATSAGKALLYTATGVFLLTVETAKAIIGGFVSACKWVANGVISVAGAVVQGITSVCGWAAKGAKAAYQKVAAWTDQAWKNVCTAAGKVMKASVQAFTAFLDGVAAAAKTIGYTLTGLAVTAWKAIKSVLSPAVAAIVGAAKTGAEFVKKGLEWIGKNVANGAKAFAATVKAGWDYSVQLTKTALAAGASMVKSAGTAIVDTYNSAAKATEEFINDMYNLGKSVWESEYTRFFGEEIIFEELDWEYDTDSFGFNNEYDFE